MPTKNTKTSKSRGLGKGIGNLFQEEDTNDQKVVVKEVEAKRGKQERI